MSTTDNYLPTSVVTSLLAFVLMCIAIRIKQVKQSNLAGKSGQILADKVNGVPSISLFMFLKSSIKFKLDSKAIMQYLFETYGEIFQLNFFGLPKIVLISNPSVVQKIYMSSDMDHVHKPDLYNKNLVGPLKDGLAASSPEVWKLHRGVLLKAYAYKGLLRQLSIFEEHTKKFVLTLQESIAPSSSEKSNILFHKQVHKLSFEIILHIAAGQAIQGQGQKEDETRFQKTFDRLKELITYRLTHPLFLPDMTWFLNPRKWEMNRQLDEISEYCYKTLQFVKTTRKQFELDEKNQISTEDDDMGGRSLVEVMIKGGLSNEEIFTQIVTFFLAGQEAVSNSFTVLMFLLARHQNHQNKCRKEIDQMFDLMSATNSTELSMELLKSLTFLDMCIKESSRLYTVLPNIARSLESPIQIDDNSFLSKGTCVFACIESIHRNPKIYPEPEKFIPERFSPENQKKFGLCEHMPFSVGIRNCIAYKSAMIQLKVMAAYVLRNFEVCSDVTMSQLECLVKKTTWPSFPELDVKIRLRQ